MTSSCWAGTRCWRFGSSHACTTPSAWRSRQGACSNCPASVTLPPISTRARASSAAMQPDPGRLLVRMAAGGPGLPFFWVHGIGGEVFSFTRLSQYMAGEREVFGFSADWTRAFPAEDRTVDRIAARYVRDLRNVWPVGPYHLGGFCSAAVLMVEIARQLEEAGERIGAFVVLDYEMQGGRDGLSPFRSAVAFARNLPRWVADDAVPSGSLELLGRVRSRLRRAVSRNHDDVRDDTGMWRFPDHQIDMLRVHRQVIRSFSSRAMSSAVSLFVPRTKPLFGPWSEGEDQGWATLAKGGVDVQVVRGSHSTMLIDPFAAELASRIKACIARAEGRRESSEATPVKVEQ
jgi:thioesterase domain-containing protein